MVTTALRATGPKRGRPRRAQSLRVLVVVVQPSAAALVSAKPRADRFGWIGFADR